MLPNSGIPLSEWSGSGATERLRESLEAFNQGAARQSEDMVALTRSIKTLTGVMLAFVVVQLLIGVATLYLTIYPPPR